MGIFDFCQTKSYVYLKILSIFTKNIPHILSLPTAAHGGGLCQKYSNRFRYVFVFIARNRKLIDNALDHVVVRCG